VVMEDMDYAELKNKFVKPKNCHQKRNWWHNLALWEAVKTKEISKQWRKAQ
jgi:hypothetical protein